MKNLSIVLVAALILVARTASAEVHFREVSFTDAKKLAAKEHKKIMVDFYTSWCGWCKVLDKKTYSDDHVGQIADAKFISIKLDAEHGEGVELAKHYEIRGYPTIMFFSDTGAVVHKVVGYQDAQHFARSLEIAAAGGSQAVIDEISSAHPPIDAGKWAIAADYYEQNKDYAHALNAYQQVAKYDPDNKQHLREEAMYGIAYFTKGEAQFEALEKALAEFPMRDDAQRATLALVSHYLETPAKAPDAARLMDRWAMSHPDDAQAFNAFAWYAAQKGLLLDKAQDFSKRALALAKDNSERAGFMDTQAELAFRNGHTAEAIEIETKAIAMLDANKDQRTLSELTKQKAKYEGIVANTQQSAKTQAH
jgi:thioredoxin-related protein